MSQFISDLKVALEFAKDYRDDLSDSDKELLEKILALLPTEHLIEFAGLEHRKMFGQIFHSRPRTAPILFSEGRESFEPNGASFLSIRAREFPLDHSESNRRMFEQMLNMSHGAIVVRVFSEQLEQEEPVQITPLYGIPMSRMDFLPTRMAEVLKIVPAPKKETYKPEKVLEEWERISNMKRKQGQRKR